MECAFVDWVDKRIEQALSYHNCNYHLNEDSFSCNRGRAIGNVEREAREKAIQSCGRVA